MSAQLDDLTLRLKSEGFEKATRVVAGLTSQVRELKLETGKTVKSFGKLTTATKKTSTGMKEVGTATQRAGKQTKVAAKEVDNAATGFLGLNDTLDKTIRKVLLWSVSTGIIFGTARAFRELFSVVTEHDQQMTALRKVYSGAESDISGIKTQIMSTSRAMQTLTRDALKAGVVVARTGRVRGEIAELTRTALIAQNIAEIEAADSVKLLNAAVIQFNEEVSESIRILDEWNELSNRTPATTMDMAQAASFAGSVFHNLRTEIQFLNAMTATLVEVTAKSGNMIGRAERTMAVYSQRISTVNKLANIGVDVYDKLTGAYRGLDTILFEVAAKWKTLSDTQKAVTAQAIAGTRQQQFFIALMENQDLVIRNLIIQWDSFGSAIKENELFLDSISKKFDGLKNAIESVAISTGDAGLTGAIKHELDLFTTLVNALNTTGGATLTLGATIAALTIGFKKSAIAGGKFAVVMRGVGKAFAWVAIAQIALEVLGLLVGRFARAATAASDFAAANKKSFDDTLAQADRLKSMADTLDDLSSARKKLTEAGKDSEEIDKNILKVLKSIQTLYPEIDAEMSDVISSQDTWNTSLQNTVDLLDDLRKKRLAEQLSQVNAELRSLGGGAEGIQGVLGGGGGRAVDDQLIFGGKKGPPVPPGFQPTAAISTGVAAPLVANAEKINTLMERRTVIQEELNELTKEGTEGINEGMTAEENRLFILEQQLELYRAIFTGQTKIETATMRVAQAQELIEKFAIGTIERVRAEINLEKQKIALKMLLTRRAASFAEPFGEALSESIASGFESDAVMSAMNSMVRSFGSALGTTVSESVTASLAKSGSGLFASLLGGGIAGGLATGIFGLIANTLFPSDEPEKKSDDIEDNTKALRELNDSISDLTQLYINAPTGFGVPGGSGFGGTGQGSIGAGSASNISSSPLSSSSSTINSISLAEGAIQITPQPGQNAQDIATQVQRAVVEIFDKGGSNTQQHGV